MRAGLPTSNSQTSRLGEDRRDCLLDVTVYNCNFDDPKAVQFKGQHALNVNKIACQELVPEHESDNDRKAPT